jgi:hypothetical protein
VTLNEILHKIQGLSPEEREVLRRELHELPGKPECESATSETIASLNEAQRSSHDERGLPIEDILDAPKPKDGA